MTESAEQDAVIVQARGSVLVVQLNRPSKRNALNPAITAGLDAALNRLDDDPELRCGILHGGASFFSAGADLTIGPGPPTPRGGLVGLITRQRLKPLIAAVEGFAVGGGMELVLSCDLVVAADNARFGLPEVKRGLMADFGGAFRTFRALPVNIANEMLLTGTDLDAVRAERVGFVNVLTAPGEALAGALALAERVSANAPLAVQASRRVGQLAAHGDETELWASSDEAHESLLRTDDMREGVSAFFERRAPNWRGQ